MENLGINNSVKLRVKFEFQIHQSDVAIFEKCTFCTLNFTEYYIFSFFWRNEIMFSNDCLCSDDYFECMFCKYPNIKIKNIYIVASTMYQCCKSFKKDIDNVSDPLFIKPIICSLKNLAFNKKVYDIYFDDEIIRFFEENENLISSIPKQSLGLFLINVNKKMITLVK